MTIMHSLLSGYLKFAGRFREAAEVESAGQPAPARREAPPESIPPSGPVETTPALVTHDGGDHGAHGATSHESDGSSSPTFGAGGGSGSSGGAAQAEGAGSGRSAGAGAESSAHSSASSAPAEQAIETAYASQPDSHVHAQPEHKSNSLHDDPLAGLHSERFKARLEREAFAGASEMAKDSAIVIAADRWLPVNVRSLLKHDMPPIDISPAARQARIDALHGAMPEWAQQELFKDPDYARSMETAAAREQPAHAPIRQPEPASEANSRSAERASSHEMER